MNSPLKDPDQRGYPAQSEHTRYQTDSRKSVHYTGMKSEKGKRYEVTEKRSVKGKNHDEAEKGTLVTPNMKGKSDFNC